MKLIIFGAAGKTGSLVVERALAAGHTVTVFLHEEKEQAPGVRVIVGDAHDAGAVRQAIAGQDAVIDSIGGKTPYKDTDLETTAARNIVAAMQAEGLRRLQVVSMIGIGDSEQQTPFWYRYRMQPTYLRGATKDKTGMEEAVSATQLDFVIVRPPLLTDDPATGNIQVITGDHKGHKITRADVAQFLIDQLGSTQYLNQAVVIANS